MSARDVEKDTLAAYYADPSVLTHDGLLMDLRALLEDA